MIQWIQMHKNINWGNIVTTNAEETKSKNSVTDNINSPSHYNSGKIEVINFIEDQNLNFSRGNAIKYIARAGKKKGSGVDEMADVVKEIEDLGKAMWYIKREIKRISGSL